MLDLRLPIGLMFSTVGLLMAIYGLATASHEELYRCSLGININLWWGAALTAFGLLMFFSGRSAQTPNDPPKED